MMSDDVMNTYRRLVLHGDSGYEATASPLEE